MKNIKLHVFLLILMFIMLSSKNSEAIQIVHAMDEEKIQSIDDRALITLQGIIFDLNDNMRSEDISLLNDDNLAYLRNGIYAKYGYVFKNKKYTNFFSKYSWYKEDDTFKEDQLLEQDIKNINLLIEHERIESLTFKSALDDGLDTHNDDITIIEEDIEGYDGGNFPTRVTISTDRSNIVFESFWNDGLNISIVDFDEDDDYIDIFISESSTDISCRTIIYRFDGQSLEAYGEIDHFFKDFLYDGKGKIYYMFGNGQGEISYNYCYDYRKNINFEIQNTRLLNKLR